MGFFSGEYGSKVDAKGRVVLPARLKSAMPENASQSVVITKGFEPCIVLYSTTEWEKLLSRIQVLSEFNEEQRNLQRNLLARSTEVDLDSAGRFVIPKHFQEYAQIATDVVILGIGTKIEIWNPTNLERYQIKDNQSLSGLAEKYLSS